MARLTPAEAAEKHMRRLQGATEDIQKGIQRVNEAPGAKAAAKQQKMLSRLTESVNSGKWANRVKSVSLEDWKKAALEKGVGRIAGGIQASQPKMQEFYAQLLPYQDTLANKIKAMPDLTIEDSIARASAQIRGMSQFKRK